MSTSHAVLRAPIGVLGHSSSMQGLVRGSIIYGPDLFEANPDLPMLLAEGKGCADIGNEYLLKHTKKVYVCCLAK
ncbi:hypothetical protein [Nitrosomonas ureae]|uniref:hypothetical protein n=1 Tax=Nitrosomonas ureae TaxID=44577 RepID=UPI00114346E4|nr:hypothetical protein [Nitrosomonas ureae]